ncbi:hypothetical protein L7F22_064487 [Adiantum nelumboides]|nr:hypothetical protein [Adiantum nelumboides]
MTRITQEFNAPEQPIQEIQDDLEDEEEDDKDDEDEEGGNEGEEEEDDDDDDDDDDEDGFPGARLKERVQKQARRREQGLKEKQAYHPQTDGQSEIANSTILDLLKSYVSERQTDWEKYLPLVEYAYNNTVHSTTGLALDLQLGQFVLLKFEKARLKKQASHKGKVVKLSNRYYGPFKITDQVNDVTFRLDLPPSWKIHNAFHVSLLRPYMGPPPSEPVTDELPEIEEMEEILEPEQIVHHQERHLKSGKITRKYLVKFKNYSALDAQWMTEQDLKHIQRFWMDIYKH